MYKDISVVILAAGFSSRMKHPKFALMFDDKRSFLEKIIKEYLTFECKEIIIVLNSEGMNLFKTLNLNIPKNVKFVLNKYPERERFYSLQIGLRAMSEINYAFIQNVDNPFVEREVLNSLYKEKVKADYIIPVYKGKGGHPILISKKVCESIINEDDIKQKLKEFLITFKTLKVGCLNQSIINNINDVDDYKRLLM